MIDYEMFERKIRTLRFLEWLFKVIGLFFIILSAILVFIFRQNEFGLIFCSIGLALYSLGIAYHSSVIAEKSDKKMEAIAFTTYQDAVGAFEDRRLNIRERGLKIDYKQYRRIDVDSNKHKEIVYDKMDMVVYLSFSIWKCLTYVKRLEPLIYWVDVTEQDELIHKLTDLYVELMNDLKNYKISISSEFYGHLQQMLEIVSEFEILKNDESRRRVLQTLLDNILPYVNVKEDENSSK